MSMGERLREARNKIGYSQEEVARRIDFRSYNYRKV